jgi:hypothetical protein
MDIGEETPGSCLAGVLTSNRSASLVALSVPAAPDLRGWPSCPQADQTLLPATCRQSAGPVASGWRRRPGDSPWRLLPICEPGLRILAPAVLGLSVTMATTQIEAHLCFQAARAEGVWVIVGGAAWGATQQPARRLGASLMLTDVGELASDVREGCPAAEAIATAPGRRGDSPGTASALLDGECPRALILTSAVTLDTRQAPQKS